MFTIQLFASTGVHSFGFRFASLRDAEKAAGILARAREFEWGRPSSFRVLDAGTGALVIQGPLRKLPLPKAAPEWRQTLLIDQEINPARNAFAIA